METKTTKTNAKASTKTGARTTAEAGTQTAAKTTSKTGAKPGAVTAAKTRNAAAASTKAVAKAAPKTGAKAGTKAAGKAAVKKAPAATTKAAPKKSTDKLRDLFIDGLKDIYWAEKAMTKTLPKMAKNATTPNLIAALNDHLEETKEQVTRLEKVFSLIGEKAVAKKCDAMEGLMKEGDGILEETEPGAVRDAGIIAASQKIEHYEIATYGTLTAFARILNEDDAARLLQVTLNEEKEADVALTEAAFNNINFDAR